MKFYTTVKQANTHFFLPSFVEIYSKMTKSCCFNQDNSPKWGQPEIFDFSNRYNSVVVVQFRSNLLQSLTMKNFKAKGSKVKITVWC